MKTFFPVVVAFSIVQTAFYFNKKKKTYYIPIRQREPLLHK
ncbi:hypothetical protein [Shouchella patagoniensis]|nr:hypothetical protein [Shouchella patagoniensis]